MEVARLDARVAAPFHPQHRRIEIAEGRLIIVAELADRNLHEMFLDLRRQGQKGIPRDTLLGYLRNVADALDFMHERHGLQHLDIKPGNLLLPASTSRSRISA